MESNVRVKNASLLLCHSRFLKKRPLPQLARLSEDTEPSTAAPEYILPHAPPTSAMPPSSSPQTLSPIRPTGDRFITSAVNNTIPALEDWPGPHQFRVAVKLPTNHTRQMPAVYNADTKKLYVDMMIPVPFAFRVKDGTDTNHLRISALPVYPEMHHVNTPVRRCPSHRVITHESNMDTSGGYVEHIEHVIRADHVNARYLCSGSTNERRSVTVPFERPQPGTDEYRVYFKFGCMNTCVGGINRRRLSILFTLENSSSGETVGRSVIEVKVCKCPHRDHKTDIQRARGSVSGQTSSKRRRQHSPPRSRHGKFLLDCGSEAMHRYLKSMRDALRHNMPALVAQETGAAPLALCQSPSSSPRELDEEPVSVPVVATHYQRPASSVKMEFL